MTRGAPTRTAGVVAALLAVAAVARAELSPETYRQMCDAADEALRLRVVSVWTRDLGPAKDDPGHGHTLHVDASAEVVSVTRSANGLTPGARVRVRYQTVVDRTAPVVGPSPVRVLAKGETVDAFLKRDGRQYVPAAMAASFAAVGPATTAATTRP